MAYQTLVLAKEMPFNVERLMRKGVEPFLKDVHCALRLPVRRPNLPAGFHFTIAQALLGVVAGTSAAFYRRGSLDGKAFQGLLVEFYPWDLEPAGPQDAAQKSEILWKTFRNPFSHSLGLAYEKQPKREQPRELKPRSFVTKVGRETGIRGMTERKVVALERSATRPNFQHPTLVVTNDKRVLWVEPFYWGIRQMLLRLTSSAELMAHVGRYVDDVLAESKGSL